MNRPAFWSAAVFVRALGAGAVVSLDGGSDIDANTAARPKIARSMTVLYYGTNLPVLYGSAANVESIGTGPPSKLNASLTSRKIFCHFVY